MDVFVLLYLREQIDPMKKRFYFFTFLLIVVASTSGCRANKKKRCADCPHFSQINAHSLLNELV